MNRDDSGHILPATVITVTLIAVAALLTGRAFGSQLRASIQERLITDERVAARNIEDVLDAWMADPALSTAITEAPNGSNGWRTSSGDALWRTPGGVIDPDCPSPPNTTCWTFAVAAPRSAALRGGEASQETRDVTIEIRSGCFSGVAWCQRITEIVRAYERTVFAQYQLHYEDHTAPNEAFWGPDGSEDPSTCTADPPPDPADCDDVPTDLLRGLPVIFAAADTLDGPLHYSGTGGVLYCGTPTFRRVETVTPQPLAKHAGCGSSGVPQWGPDGPDEQTNTGLALPATGPVPTHLKSPQNSCPIVGASQPPDFGCHPTNVTHGDIIHSDGDMAIEGLDLSAAGASVTVHARGDITITGDITTSGTNAAGGPAVIALIAGGDIVLAHTHPADITFTNVALLAQGAVYARGWHLPCNGTCPTFTLTGSIAATHLGLYGIPSPSGGVTSGWAKQFTYPADFWRARPPWWPGYNSHPIPEWQSA